MKEQTREEILATIEKLKKQVETIDSKPTVLSMEITETVKFEVAKEDEKGHYSFNEATEIDFSNGWRLPTIEELEAMAKAKIITKGLYWSSTEVNSSHAWYYDFNNGSSYYANKSSTCIVYSISMYTFRVRAVRTIK